MKHALILVMALAALTGCQKHVRTTPTPTPNARTVTVNWTASLTPGVTYNVYRAAASCTATGTFIKLTPSPINALTYNDLNVPTGTYCYYATSYLASATPPESVASNKAEAVVTDTQPSPPTQLNVTPAAVTMQIGTQQQFSAARGVQPVPAAWSISPPDEGAISTTGLYQAPPEIKGNNVRVQVLASDSEGSGTAEITLRK